MRSVVATVRIHKRLQLSVDPVRTIRRVSAIPTLDFVGERGGSLQGHAIEQISYFIGNRLVLLQSSVGDRADQLMAAWSIGVAVN